MGLELNEETIAQNMPEYALVTRQNASVRNVTSNINIKENYVVLNLIV